MPLVNHSGAAPIGGGDTGGGSPSAGLENVNNATETRTLTNEDLSGNKIIYMQNTVAGTLTIPAGLTGSEPVTVVQEGSGTTDIVAATGVTIQSKANRVRLVQDAAATIIPKGTDTYRLMGDLS